MSKKIGLLLRSYAKTPEDVPGVVARAVKSIEHASGLRNEDDRPLFTDIVVITPCEYDCGATAGAILKDLPSSLLRRVSVFELPGHHSCGSLNGGIDVLASLDVDYVVIISNKAIQALTAGTMEAMLEAFDRGAKVVGVAIDELQDIVLEGRIQNTYAGWNIKALQEVGGFDSENGVEEIAPTVRMIQKYGPCIAVLRPKDITLLDIRKNPDGEARHSEVMNTKIERQISEVQRLGVDHGFIKSGLTLGYPLTVCS